MNAKQQIAELKQQLSELEEDFIAVYKEMVNRGKLLTKYKEFRDSRAAPERKKQQGEK